MRRFGVDTEPWTIGSAPRLLARTKGLPTLADSIEPIAAALTDSDLELELLTAGGDFFEHLSRQPNLPPEVLSDLLIAYGEFSGRPTAAPPSTKQREHLRRSMSRFSESGVQPAPLRR